MKQISVSLKELASYLSADLEGDPDAQVYSIAPLDKSKAGDLTYCHSPAYRPFLKTTQATAVILSPKDKASYSGNSLTLENPYLGYAKAASLFLPPKKTVPGIHPTAVVGARCQIASTSTISAHCVLGDDVCIGENTLISPGCCIGDFSVIGKNGLLYSNVTLYHNVIIGDGIILHSGVVIGSDGFGIANDKGTWIKIPQLGGVRIGNNVEVGANTTIDRGALEDTVIEDGVKLDNLIQIAHNVSIGAHTAIAATTAVAGSTKIGKYCMIGGGAAIAGHLEIADGVILTAKSEVLSSIHKVDMYSSGMPILPTRQWKKSIVRFAQLEEIVKRLKKLEKDRGNS